MMSSPPVPGAPEPAPSPGFGEVVARLRAAGCVFAEEEAGLLVGAARTPAELSSWVARREAGLPLEHILGWAHFAGMRVTVDPGVFVPRRRTELLVRMVLSVTHPGDLVVDLCCGSAAIGAAVLAAIRPVRVHLVDIDAAAVRCARRNVRGHRAVVHRGDLFDALPVALRGHVDVLAVNAPYVPTDQLRLLPAEAREHEPSAALDGGPDGLAVQRRVLADAGSWLAPGGRILVETSDDLADGTRHLVAAAGLEPRTVRDRQLAATVVLGRKPDR